MLVTSCSSIHTNVHFEKHVIITTIISETGHNTIVLSLNVIQNTNAQPCHFVTINPQGFALMEGRSAQWYIVQCAAKRVPGSILVAGHVTVAQWGIKHAFY